MENTKIKINENDKIIMKALKNGSLTLSEINAAMGTNLKSGHINAAINKGLIAAEDKQVQRISKAKRSTYILVNSNETLDSNGKTNKYSDTEKWILANHKDAEPITLAALGELLGHRIYSGTINSLVKKGNYIKGNDIMVNVTTRVTVHTYKLVEKN